MWSIRMTHHERLWEQRDGCPSIRAHHVVEMDDRHELRIARGRPETLCPHDVGARQCLALAGYASNSS